MTLRQLLFGQSYSRRRWQVDFMVAAIALLVFVCILQFTLAIPSKSRKCRSANDEELDEMIKRTGITQMINRRLDLPIAVPKL